MPYHQMSDEALLERIAGRDRAALSALYDRYAPGALAVAARVTGERSAAETAVEHLFWSVWRGEIALDGNTRHSLMLNARRLAHGRVPSLPGD